MRRASSVKPLVGVLIGSDSDLPVMAGCARVLEEYGIGYEAHDTARYVRAAEGRGLRVLVAGAGGAAHLAGAVAAHTSLPVIGVPLASSPLGGFDALLATVQMPPGVPVATMGVGPMGAANAGHFAVAILALGDAGLRRKLRERRQRVAAEILVKSRDLDRRLREIPKSR
ncbi:MAG: 5-(carboxyamino)imidazole ribonucleotide mutase [Acidobacteria bacterium]|nr:MAG: 5-(carboxyamino)imidazole ribonucleotide mutase [Acidobacteriota bacterium]